MLLFSIMLFVVFAAITVRDVRIRLIHISDLLLLCAIRVVLLAASSVPVFGIDGSQWGVGALLESLLLAFALTGMFWLLGLLVSKITGSSALGEGDVLLLAACCLFLSFRNIDAYLLLVVFIGIALSLVWLIAKKDKTFPFAPALVWPCWLVMLMT